ncbi:unnamed protein product [Pelagomonas calceolata]|uniref:Acyltransferase 3 domain-containing protein n=1 Tax=Pelagomonas calceolata TaxID=35677 RepID=A0A7S4EC97_9STRA|nr:unnamed protein product [Pelagomonas calceolata]|mmetsp:Transcript_3411/g.10080  ORF Transcript_3411/g.10080 Transcript_3411/m.10080 type:complete len:477 (+) Transcript_3411:64-1494(+)
MAAAWQTITAWACLLLAGVAVHLALGEVVLTVLLIVFTTVAFTGRKGPQQINDSHAEDVDIEVQHPDEDEPTTANPLNASEQTPKLRPLRSPSAELRRSAPAEAAPVAAARLPFLDNVKVFLTALVVLHHCACAFGACGEGTWYLIVKGGGGPRAFRFCVKTFVTLNQAYFMTLFFFVSAYFVPTSYAKGGWPTFQANKRRRLLVPALAVLLVASPLTTLVAGNLTYAPSPGVGWYLWWLLLFNVVYASFQSVNPPVDEALAEALTGADAAPTAARGPRLLLSTVFRIGAGLGICGLALLPFLVLTKGSFASMPVSIGSVTCDFLMFYLGLQAKKQGWLERPLAEQLDVHPLVLLTFVVVEAAGIAVASLDVDKFGLVVVMLAGMFCLDMSLLVLLTFQRWGNVETRVTRFLARGAFGVYLLHPLVVTAATRVYLKLAGDGVNYPVGFAFVAVVSLLVVWPLAYSLAQLPGLKTIL